MKNSQICIFFIVIFLAGCMGQPKTYEDCVLNNISGKTEEFLLEKIDDMCALKFEDKNPPSVSIPMDENFLNLDGHINAIKKEIKCSQCGDKITPQLEGYVYNGSEKWIITELVILIKIDNNEKKYKVVPYYSSLPPLSKRNFIAIEIEDNLYEKMKNGNYKWRFSEAYGYLKSKK
ncbi:hypothetical protein CI610_03678 [invertebrate metagenome]|uniref:Lipoprotein n=1 Tax=invertebrate metagenome TaxID=1711999 RepID=A0A2H9T2F7_9ZZZZ